MKKKIKYELYLFAKKKRKEFVTNISLTRKTVPVQRKWAGNVQSLSEFRSLARKELFSFTIHDEAMDIVLAEQKPACFISTVGKYIFILSSK